MAVAVHAVGRGGPARTIPNVSTYEPVRLHRPWQQLPWLAPGALATLMMLGGMSIVLGQRPVRPPEPRAILARLIEMPPAGGVQGNGAAAAPVKPAQPKPVRHKPVARIQPSEKPAPPMIPSPGNIATATTGIATGRSEGPPTEASLAPSEGAGSGGGIGSDSVGARAIYAPLPKIPDDLRDQILRTVAIAHFVVSSEGAVKVTLAKATDNPRLNQILLTTLQQWKFFPAVKDGVAIDSMFDVRIPIVVE